MSESKKRQGARERIHVEIPNLIVPNVMDDWGPAIQKFKLEERRNVSTRNGSRQQDRNMLIQVNKEEGEKGLGPGF